MGRVIVAAAVSVDGFIADSDRAVGELFDWYQDADMWFRGMDPDRTFDAPEADADHVQPIWNDIGALVIGRRLFDLTDGWHGHPAVGEHVFVVTHTPPTDWPYRGAPFTFVTDGVPSAIAQAAAFCGTDRDVLMNAGEVGRQALAAGLVDVLDLALLPIVLGSGVRYFGGFALGPVLLENPTVVEGARVTHLRYEVRRQEASG